MGENKLGRGLGALFGDFTLDDELTPIDEPVKQPKKQTNQTTVAEKAPAESEVQQIAIAMIDNNINQPRKVFDQDDLHDLAESIRTYGVIQPILITPVGNRFMIVAGERRWRAARMAGLVEIPAIIKKFNQKQIAEIAIIENLQRADLNDMELAQGIKKLMDDHNLTQEKVAERLSKPRSTIANTLRLLSLPSEVQQFIAHKQLTAGHAIRLMGISDERKQIEYARRAVDENLSVRALGELIDGKMPNLPAGKAKPPKAPEIREQEKILSRAIGTKVKIEGSLDHGKVVIGYYSAEELERIVNYLKNHKI
ncbi:MAG: ParB/RepB/Spo0J family partition protein [Eubacteriales bacterium]|nr:ParB/RepB/Spo0J family partition protein [Eubacteriales bacterium]